MEAAFWHERWASGRTAWHRNDFNPALLRLWPTLGVAPGSRALVPLCGAANDMAWLHEQGHPVIGVDLSEIGLRTFAKQHGYDLARSEQGEFVRLAGESPEIELLAGDMLAVDAARLDDVAAVFDRAALVALEPGLRKRYVDHLLGVLPRTAKWLLLAYEYPKGDIEGPPFSVPPADVEALFARASSLELVESHDILTEEHGLAKRGATSLTQHAFIIQP